MAETPNIHLSLGTDADVNRNWEILDAAIRAFGARQIIPEDVLIQGNLEVTGDENLHGALMVGGPTTLGVLNVSGPSTFLGAVGLESGLIVPNGPITFPAGSLDPSFLAANAATFLVQTGTAVTANQAIGTTPTQLATLLMPPTEDPTRWQLVIIQATINVTLSADVALTNNQVTLTMRRGGAAGVDQQSRILHYSLSRTTYMEIPVTMVRLCQPPQLDEKRWSLFGQVASSGIITITCTFGQVYCLQFR